MNTIFRVTMTGVMLACLAGCTNAPDGEPLRNSDVRQMFPITVEPQVASLRVQVDGDGLASGEDIRVRGFAQGWITRGQGGLSLSVPGQMASQATTLQAVSSIREILRDEGVDDRMIREGRFDAAAQGSSATIVLSFTTTVAQAQTCGTDWSKNLDGQFDNLPWPEFGCSTQRNLAAIVADPRDLNGTRPTDAADPGRRSTVLDKYRKGEPTAAKTTDDTAGKVSDIK